MKFTPANAVCSDAMPGLRAGLPIGQWRWVPHVRATLAADANDIMLELDAPVPMSTIPGIGRLRR